MIREVFHAHLVDYAYPSHCHETWAVLIVDEGAIQYDLDRRRCGAAGQAVTILPPGVAHDGRPAPGASGFRKRELYLEPAFLRAELTGAAVDHTVIRREHHRPDQPGPGRRHCWTAPSRTWYAASPAEFGLSPYAYVTGRRVDAARRLLLAGAAPAYAATAVGFYDQAHLTRHFKKHTATTPAVYARSHERVPAAFDGVATGPRGPEA